jgi:hypothetical protein
LNRTEVLGITFLKSFSNKILFIVIMIIIS